MSEDIPYTIEDWLASLTQASQMLEDGTAVLPDALRDALMAYVLSELATLSEEATPQDISNTVLGIALVALFAGTIHASTSDGDEVTALVSTEDMVALVTQSVRDGAIRLRLEIG